MDSSHEQLLAYNPNWQRKYENELAVLIPLFKESALDIQHIGSTAVPGLVSKPIIDIAVLLKSHTGAEAFVPQLREIGYNFDEVAHAKGAAPERHFFRKGEPTIFHLSLAYANKGSFWKRQILFRDYLREHPEAREEYQRIKHDGLKNDPTGGDTYIGSKTKFVDEVLTKAGFVKYW